MAPILALALQANPATAGALERAMLGKSTIVDLTHSESERTALTDPQRPPASAEEERQGLPSSGPSGRDFGTRLNGLGIVRKDKRTIARIQPRELLAVAVVVNVVAKVAESPEYRVTVGDLLAWERQNGRIPRRSAVLLYTGWARRWADSVRYANLDAQGLPRVPGFSAAALAFLVDERQVLGVGLDAFTPESSPGTAGEESARVPVGAWQIENLAHLDRLPVKGTQLIVAPIRVEAASAPARVIGILP